MTAPSNANTSGLEVVQWEYRTAPHRQWHITDSKAVADQEAKDGSEVVPRLARAASAQARIDELEADLSKVIAQRDSHWDEYLAERQSRMEHGAREAGYLETISKLTDRATAAEARSDRLAKALEEIRDADPYHVSHPIARDALQQEG